LLPELRDRIKCETSPFLSSTEIKKHSLSASKLHEYKVLPWIDLMIWKVAENNDNLSNPDRYKLVFNSVMDDELIKKVKFLVNKALDLKYITVLYESAQKKK